MQTQIDHSKRKGGRPKTAVKKDQLLGVKCSLIERKAIEAKAKSVNLPVSEYLRKMGLSGKIILKILPKVVLERTGIMSHVAANLNQIARKRNRGDELNAIERAELMDTSAVVKQAAKEIINFLK
ncbi:MAG TPA: mobilization protein [Puia sp.]|jgi:hypothetical protein|nr:mobilization protein [Puia sp.]